MHDPGSTYIEGSNSIIEAVVLDLSKVSSGFHTYSERAVLSPWPTERGPYSAFSASKQDELIVINRTEFEQSNNGKAERLSLV